MSNPNKRRGDILEVDCWGFRPSHSLDTAINIVSAIISQNYDEWGTRSYGRAQVTVFGRDAHGNESKVRIGHDGKVATDD